MVTKKLVLGPLSTNCYIVACENTNEAIVIDPADEVEKIVSFLEQENWQAKHILLTHAHIDHVGALVETKAATGATILMHSNEKVVLNGVEMQAAFLGLAAPKIGEPDRLISDGEKITFGSVELTVLSTPGHTPGGLSFLGPGCVFVGDALFAGSIGRTDLPLASHETLMRSICEKLMVLPEDTIVYCGHGPDTTIGEEKRFNPFLSC